MAMRVERYSTGGDKIPAAARLLRYSRVILCVLAVFFISRSGQPVSALCRQGAAVFSDGGLKVVQTGQTGVRWPDGGHALIKPDAVFYCDTAFRIVHKTNIREPLRFSVSSFGYATYKKVGKTISVFNRKGERLFRLKSRTYPRISSEKGLFFLITGDQSGIRVIDSKGHSAGGLQQVGPMITSYDLSRRGGSAYFGLISGVVEKFSLRNGKSIWRKKIRGSRIRLIKGIAASRDGKTVGLVSGLEPERFSLLDSGGKLLWSTITGGAVRTRVSLRVGRRFCAGYTDGGVYLLDRKSGSRLFSCSSFGGRPVRFLGFADTASGNRTLLTWADSARAHVVLFDRDGSILHSWSFSSPYAFPAFSEDGFSFSIQTVRGISIYAEGAM